MTELPWAPPMLANKRSKTVALNLESNHFRLPEGLLRKTISVLGN